MAIASTIGNPLKPFEGKFYQSLESNCTTRGGFQHSKELNVPTEAPDWNPSPDIDCGQGLHIVKGHPLFTHRFVGRINPKYAEVVTVPNPPVPSKYTDGKFRAEKVIKVRWISGDSPEFSPEVLSFIAKNDSYYDVRQAAVNKLDPAVHSDLLADIAKNDSYYDVRQAARAKIKEVEK